MSKKHLANNTHTTRKKTKKKNPRSNTKSSCLILFLVSHCCQSLPNALIHPGCDASYLHDNMMNKGTVARFL